MKYLFKIFIVILSAGIITLLYFCSKESLPPAVLTGKVSEITTTRAISGGIITSDGGNRITERGICWNTSTNPTIDNYRTSDGKGSGIFQSTLEDLEPGTIYYVKAYAANKEGITYGFETAFSTLTITAVLTTAIASEITTNSATAGGVITSNGGYEVTARGVCWDTVANPTLDDPHTADGAGIGSFTSCLTGLLPDTWYYVRAYATNSGGTAYGYQISFGTYPELGPIVFNPDLTYGSLTDIDGNTYKTILIGTQTWMAENLRTSKLNDGTAIHFVPEGEKWNDPSPAYCVWYNGFYGSIYNFYTVATGKLCPAGWHVPSYEEGQTLINFLGGKSIAGGKLKETGTSHWRSPNAGATNSSGFTALPGGYSPGGFGAISLVSAQGRWWRSENGDIFCLNRDSINIYGMSCLATCGMTVRCIED
ncbi:MAG: FISUMP domain-containing protein [Bacteroidota bacterium]